MHKKITVRNTNNRLCYFVLDSQSDISQQLHTLYGIDSGHGISVELEADCITVMDYYHAERIGSIPIVSQEYTDLPVALYWTDAEPQQQGQ